MTEHGQLKYWDKKEIDSTISKPDYGNPEWIYVGGKKIKVGGIPTILGIYDIESSTTDVDIKQTH